MKWINLIFLLVLVGGVSAQSVLPPSKVITYDYNSTIVSGVLKASSQHSVFTVQSKLKVITLSTKPFVYFKLEDIRVGEKNEELSDVDLEKIVVQTVKNGPFEEALKIPFGARFENGKVLGTYFEEDKEEPWSKDLKKGIIDLFQLPKGQGKESRKPSNIPQEDLNKMSKSYNSRELSVIGKCDVQVTEESLTYPGNPQVQVLNVTRLHNLEKCNNTAEFALSNHPAFRCKECYADREYPVRNNMITKLGVEIREGNFIIEKIYRVGAVTASLMGSEGDVILSIYNQWAVMRGMETQNSQGPILAKTKEESPISDLHAKMKVAYSPAMQTPNQEITANVTNGFRRLLDEVAESTENRGDINHLKRILSHEILIQKAFSFLPQSKLKQVVEEHLRGNSEREQIKRRAVLDILARTGTKDAIEVIVKLIREKKVADEQRILSLLRNIPTHVLLPDSKIAEIVLNLCTGERNIIQSRTLQKHCYFSFASVVARACTKYNSTHTSRPVPTEKNCPRSVLKSQLAQIKRAMEEHKEREDEEMEIAFATVLGIMNARDSVFALESRIKGQGTDSPLVQMASIYASRFLSLTFPEEVSDVLFSVLYNSRERSEVRIAAASVILSSIPSKLRIDELAHYTWMVKDQQVGAFIVAALKAISNLTLPGLRNMAKNANHSLDIVNMKAEDGILMAHTVAVDNMLSFIQAGYAGYWSFIGDFGSSVPTEFHLGWGNFASGYFNSILEFSVQGRGLKDAFDKLFGPGKMYTPETMGDIIKTLNRPLPNMGLDIINEKLGIKPRFGDIPKLLVAGRVLHHKFIQGYFNASEVLRLLERVIQHKDSVESSGRFDFLRYAMPLDIKYVIPSGAGHHLHLDIKLPMMVGLRGNYSVKGAGVEGGLSAQINVEPTFAGKLNVKFGPVLPCRVSSACVESRNRPSLGPVWGVHYATGFETTVLIKPSMCGTIEVNFDHQNNNIRLALTPTESSRGSKDIFYYETKPFTVMYSRSSLGRLVEFERPMRFMEKPFEVDRPVSITSSSDVILKGSHEDEWLDQANIISALQQRQFGGLINFPFLTQRLRKREFRLEMAPKSSTSKYTANLYWDFKPAESDPRIQPKNIRQCLWSALSGWFRIPGECSDVDPSAKPWEVRRSKMFMTEDAAKFRASFFSIFEDSSIRSSEEEVSTRDSGSFSEELRSKEYSFERFSKNEDFSRFIFRGSGQNLQIQTVQLGKGAAVLRLSGSLQVKGGKDVTYILNSTMRSDRESLVKNLDVSFTKQGSDGSFRSSLKGTFTTPRRPCFFGGSTISDERDKQKTSEVVIQWGESQGSMSNTIRAKATASKTSDQRQFDSLSSTDKRKPWFYERCEKERRRGFLNHDACQKVLDHRSLLQRVQLDVDFSQARISPEFRKFAVRAQKLLMHELFDHMSEDLEDVEQPGRASVVLNFNYTMPVLDLIVKTSTEKTIFKNVFFGKALPGFMSPSTRKSMMRQVQDYVTNFQAPPACLAAGRYLRTFDNETLDLKGVGDCPHLLAKDCSTGNSFYVLVKNNDRNKDNDKRLIVGVLKHVITIVPREAGSKKDIWINGQEKPTEEKTIHYLNDPSVNGSLVAVIVKTSPLYNILLPYLGIRIKFDGNNVKVKASHLMRGKLCGLCGEFRGRKRYNRIGPDQCSYPTDEALLSKFVVRDGSCGAVNKPSSKFCATDVSKTDNMKEKMIDDLSMFTLGAIQSIRAKTAKPPVTSRNPNCNIQRRIVKKSSRRTCLSDEPQPQCSPTCSEINSRDRQVPAFCFRNNDSRLEDAEKLGDNGKLQEVLKKLPDSRMSVRVPASCSPNV